MPANYMESDELEHFTPLRLPSVRSNTMKSANYAIASNKLLGHSSIVQLLFYKILYRCVQLTVNFGFVLRGSSPCTARKSFVRINFENNAMPLPPPGIGNENFILCVCVNAFVCLCIFYCDDFYRHRRRAPVNWKLDQTKLNCSPLFVQMLSSCTYFEELRMTSRKFSAYTKKKHYTFPVACGMRTGFW